MSGIGACPNLEIGGVHREGHLRPQILKLGTPLALIAPRRANGGNIVEVVLTHIQQVAPVPGDSRTFPEFPSGARSGNQLVAT